MVYKDVIILTDVHLGADGLLPTKIPQMKKILILTLLLTATAAFGQGASRLGGNNAMAAETLSLDEAMEVFEAVVVLAEDYDGPRNQPATRAWAKAVLRENPYGFSGEQLELFASTLRRTAARDWDGVSAAMNAALSAWTQVVPSGDPGEIGSGAKGCLAGGQCAADNQRAATGGNHGGYVTVMEARGLTPERGRTQSGISGKFDAKKEWRRIKRELRL